MIVLDTHIWVWWVHGTEYLTQTQIEVIAAHEKDVIGVSAISCWEIAKLVEYDRLELPCPLEEWFEQALNYPGVYLFPLTPEIAIESTRFAQISFECSGYPLGDRRQETGDRNIDFPLPPASCFPSPSNTEK